MVNVCPREICAIKSNEMFPKQKQVVMFSRLENFILAVNENLLLSVLDIICSMNNDGKSQYIIITYYWLKCYYNAKKIY
jgi:hypothetical protein